MSDARSTTAGAPRPATRPQPVQQAAGVAAASQAVVYDADVIHGFARTMYARATTITMLYAIGGVVLVGALGSVMGGFAGASSVGAFMGAIVGGAFGFFVGNMKANALRLEAQVALCQVEIEKNTRS